MPTIEIRAQKGPQEAFFATPAYICIYGGAAGGGKTYGLLLAPLRHIGNSGFRATIFRKNANQIYAAGGLLDESSSIYAPFPGVERRSAPTPTWIFKSGARINFAHIERDEDLMKWQGSQIAMIGYDELTHFTERQFFFMLSRNRSTCGVRPFIRATCNPDADSWVAKFIEWWIDPDTGYPIRERSGKLRWFVRRNETLHWADSREELYERFNLQTDAEREEPKSVTFIASTLSDNKILLEKNPDYLHSLNAMPELERERLLHGNWKIKPAAGLFFKRNQVGEILTIVPADVIQWVRAWDLAATSEDEGGEPAYTAGVLMGKRKDGRYVIADVINIRQTAADVRKTIKLTAETDRARFKRVRIRQQRSPGGANGCSVASREF